MLFFIHKQNFMRKALATAASLIMVMHAPLSTFAYQPTEEEFVTSELMSLAENPTALLMLMENEMKLNYKEKMQVSRIVKQLDTSIASATTNEDRIQKTINMDVYLLDTMLDRMSPIIEKAIASKDDPEVAEEIEKMVEEQRIVSKLKVL
jgi:hypothetical protein